MSWKIGLDRLVAKLKTCPPYPFRQTGSDITELRPQPLVQQHGRIRDNHVLYATSRDGFSNAAFHEACDGKAPTVTFVLLRNKRCVECVAVDGRGRTKGDGVLRGVADYSGDTRQCLGNQRGVLRQILRPSSFPSRTERSAARVACCSEPLFFHRCHLDVI